MNCDLRLNISVSCLIYFVLFFLSFFLSAEAEIKAETKFHGLRILVCRYCSQRVQDELMEGRREALSTGLSVEKVSAEELGPQ